MQEKLLSELLTYAPHINHKIADDWIANVIIDSKETVEIKDDYHSKEDYLDQVVKNVRFHIKRVNGIGGSEMSVLYTEYKGGFFPIEGVDAASVVAQKLCLTTPGVGNGNTRRGIELEPYARKSFEKKMKKFGLKVHHDAFEALNKLNIEGGVKNHEWMKSSPDGIYYEEKTGKVWLVDFKVPSEHSAFLEMTENPQDYYRAQLAQYKYHLGVAGIKVDHVALVPFSTKDWDVGIAEFNITEELTNDVLAAGDKYWKNILNNELPVRPMSENFQYVNEMPKEAQQIIADFILTKRMMSIAKNRDDKNKPRLLKMLSICGIDWNQAEQKTRIPGLDITNKSKMAFNNKKIHTANRAGIVADPDSDEYKTASETTTVSVIRSKNSPHYAFIEELENSASRAFDFAIEDMIEINGFEITEKEIENMVKDPTSPFFGNEEVQEFFEEVGYSVKKEQELAI